MTAVSKERAFGDSLKMRQDGVLSNVSRVRKRLLPPNSRRPCVVTLNRVSLVAITVYFLTLPGGAVLTPYRRLFTKHIAYTEQKRSCTSIEMDADYFKAALNRLRHIVKPNLTTG